MAEQKKTKLAKLQAAQNMVLSGMIKSKELKIINNVLSVTG